MSTRGELASTDGTGLDVVVSGTASDAHTWSLVLLQLVLAELGHRVTNLGACVPVDLLAEECRRLRPDLIVISTVNGHGLHDGIQIAGRLRTCPELARTPAIIGGKLGITGADRVEEVDRLIAAGFDAVFADDASLTAFRSFVTALPAGRPR